MPRGAAARRHAQAVFQLAEEKGQLEQWLEELNAIAAALSEPQLMDVLENPRVHLSEKMELINRCLPGVEQLLLNLVYLLVSRGRLRLMEEIVSEYHRLLDAYRGVEHAEVTTAIPLDEEEKQTLSERLAAITGAEVVLTAKVAPEIIGGFVARIGDRVLDGSIKTRLDQLRKSLAQAR